MELAPLLVRSATAALQRGDLQVGEPLCETDLVRLVELHAQPEFLPESRQTLSDQIRGALSSLVAEGVLCQYDYQGNPEASPPEISHRVFWFTSSLSSTGLGKRPVPVQLAATPPRKKQAVDLKPPDAMNISAKATTRTPFRSPLVTPSRPFRSPMPSTTPFKNPSTTPHTPATKKITSKPFSRPFRSPSMVKSTPTGCTSSDRTPIKHEPTQPRTSEHRELETVLRELETRNRRLKLALNYVENDEPNKIDTLIEKWTAATREAITRLRDNIGPVIVTEQQALKSKWGYGEDGQDDKRDSGGGSWGDQVQPRLLTLKEVCERLKIDPEMLGRYDDDNDEFVD